MSKPKINVTYLCRSVKECMYLHAAANRLKRYLVDSPDMVLRFKPGGGEYTGWVSVRYDVPNFPWLAKPDFMGNDCGAILVQLGRYRYVIERV